MSLVTQQQLDDYRAEIEAQAFVAREINDASTSTTGTWSSSKIAAEIAAATPPPVTYFALTAANSGSTVKVSAGSPLTFTDSGGSGSDYQNAENYWVVFDCGSGGAAISFQSTFIFEHSTYSMYDRLGIQTSDSNIGATFTNVSVPWLQTSATTSPPWSASYGGSSWSSSASKNGWVLPLNAARARSLGWDDVLDRSFTLSQRYVRFWFTSDSSVTKPGWVATITRL